MYARIYPVPSPSPPRSSQSPCSHPLRGVIDCYVGALKATNNRGLQPALDHLTENEEKPVPDLSSVFAIQPAGGRDPMEEDDDLEALRAVYGTGADGSDPNQSEAEAKVRCHSALHLSCFLFGLRFLYLFGIRVSSVASAGRCLRTPLLRTIMRRRAGTTSLRNPLKRCVCGVDLSDRGHRVFD